VLAEALGFVACDSDQEESQATAERSLCTGREGFSATVVSRTRRWDPSSVM